MILLLSKLIWEMHPTDRTEDFRKYLFLKSKRLNKNVIGKKLNGELIMPIMFSKDKASREFCQEVTHSTHAFALL